MVGPTEASTNCTGCPAQAGTGWLEKKPTGAVAKPLQLLAAPSPQGPAAAADQERTSPGGRVSTV